MLNFFKKRWYFVVILLFLVIGFIFYQKTINTQIKAKKEATFVVKRIDLEDSLTLSGKVDADEHAVLRFQASGMMNWVGVKEGDYVKKYQGLASLDQRELQKTMKKYLNTYMSERWDFDQTKEDKQIKNIGGLSEDARREALRVLDKAQFDLDNSVIDVELKDITLKYAYLYTPIEGLVTRVAAPFAGTNITPASAEFEVINPKTVFLSATADQVDVVRLSEGLTGEITFDAYPEITIPGTISKIAFVPKTGESGTVYEVKVVLSADNSNYKYRYGMTADINFILNKKENVLAVPANYVKTEKNLPAGRQDRKYVMKKENNKKVKTFVTIGEEIDGNLIITSGLKVGDIVTD